MAIYPHSELVVIDMEDVVREYVANKEDAAKVIIEQTVPAVKKTKPFSVRISSLERFSLALLSVAVLALTTFMLRGCTNTPTLSSTAQRPRSIFFRVDSSG